MKKQNLKIGEHYFLVECNFNTDKQFFKNFNILSEVAGIIPDMYLTIVNGYGDSFSDYNVEITKSKNSICYQRTDYRIEVNSEFNRATIMVYDDFALKHALLNLYSSFIVFHNWGLLMHSSCVLDHNKAHMFAGHSGAGKSTAARLSQPRELLSDEATIIKVENDSVTVYNSPFRSDTETNEYVPESPLKSIQLLVQSRAIKRTRIKKSEAVIDLIGKVFYWKHDPEDTKKVLLLLTKLIVSVPVYELQFEKNNNFWELIT